MKCIVFDCGYYVPQIISVCFNVSKWTNKNAPGIEPRTLTIRLENLDNWTTCSFVYVTKCTQKKFKKKKGIFCWKFGFLVSTFLGAFCHFGMSTFLNQHKILNFFVPSMTRFHCHIQKCLNIEHFEKSVNFTGACLQYIYRSNGKQKKEIGTTHRLEILHLFELNLMGYTAGAA